MTGPRVAIPLPTSTDAPYNQRSWPMYASGVERAGGEPVKVDPGLSASDLRALVRGCSAVLLPGSPADVAPSRYGAELNPATNKADPAREAVDWTLLEESERHRLPVLGICYGIQSLNVYSGGSLLQDLLPLPVNHAAGREVAIAHSVEIAPQSLLASILSLEEAPEVRGFRRLPVNSSHHQAIAEPGPGLRIVARCPNDGVIEAVEREFNPARPWFVLGVQWHPERSLEISAASRGLFARLVAEAQHHAGLASQEPETQEPETQEPETQEPETQETGTRGRAIH